MKFVRFTYNKEPQLGVYTKEGTSVLLLNSFLKKPTDNLLEVISTITDEELSVLKGSTEKPMGQFTYVPADSVKILPVVTHLIHDIICVGVNYKEHLEETKRALNRTAFDTVKKSVYFSKRGGNMLGHNDIFKARFDLDEKVDYEAELAVIIGKGGKDISPESAEDHIFGYTILNDLSARGIQNERVQWYLGKSLDGYCSIGPVVVHKSTLPFPLHLEIKSVVNGEVRQHSNTRLMIHDVPSIIADLSSHIALEPGDIIATGTPSGVGLGFTPPRFLKKGDTITCEIEGIGSLTNKLE